MISQYITQFCNGELTNVDAFCLLRCDLSYFYEECSGMKYGDITDDEFEQYTSVLLEIQCSPETRSLLEVVAHSYEVQLDAELAEIREELNVEKEVAEFEYRREIDLFSFC